VAPLTLSLLELWPPNAHCEGEFSGTGGKETRARGRFGGSLSPYAGSMFALVSDPPAGRQTT
jgi:hypothetical protein